MTNRAFPLEKIGKLVSKIEIWNPSRDASGQRIRYIDLGSVDNERKTITGHQDILAAEAPSRARQRVIAGDILVSTVRPNLNGVARVPSDLDGATVSTGFCVLRANTNQLSAEYLFHWVTGQSFVSEMMAKATGQSYPAVSDRIIWESQIPLPPFDEQRRIAAILDQADILRRKRQEALNLSAKLARSIFRERFGDLGTNSMRWAVSTFGDVCANEDFKRKPVKAADREGMAGEYPYYGASGVIDSVNDYLFDGERLLIGEDGANLIARSTPIAFMAHGQFWVNNHAHVLAANGKTELRFLEYFFDQLDLKPYISGSAQPKLNQANLDRIPVPVPPLALQRKFVEELERLEALSNLASEQLSAMDKGFGSLQALAFRGEL